MYVSIASLRRCSLTYNFLVLPVTDSCFVPEPSFARILIPSPSNLLSIHFTTQNTRSCLDHQLKKWLRHGVIHSSPNTNSVVLYRSNSSTTTRHWLAFGPDRLHAIKNFAIQSTSQADFQDTNTNYAIQVSRSTNVLGSKWPPLDCHLPRNQSSLGELIQNQTPRLRYLSSHPDSKDPLTSTNHICFFIAQNRSSWSRCRL